MMVQDGLERVQHEALIYYRTPLFDDVKHGIFTRHGGLSAPPFASLNLGGNIGDDPAAVRANHLRMFGALGLDDDRACSVWQVHSADVVVATAPHPERRWLAQADALITNVPGLPLSLRFADCTPILLYDPRQQAIGAVHAGWRGTVQGAVTAAVRAMAEAFGTAPADLRAWIGPSIGVERYEVGPEVLEAALAHFGSLEAITWHNPKTGRHHFDLWAANRLDLERAGVRQIATAGLCTATHTDEFFSHRAEAGKTGRFGAVISL